MRNLLILLLAAIVCIATPLSAQDKKMDDKAMADMMKPPEPLDDDFMSWMAGEWEGWSEGAMGKSKDLMKFKVALDGQFLLTENQGTSDMGTYKGMGALTKDPETGKIIGVWLDNYRNMLKGNGTREGNKMTMEWEGKMGTGVRITEKVSDDKFVVTEKWTMPDGMVTDMKSEFTRVKSMTSKH